jgi:hypothetical protein
VPAPPSPPVSVWVSSESTSEEPLKRKQISVKVIQDGRETSIEQNADGITVIYPGPSGEKVEVKAKDLDDLKASPEAYEVYRKYVSGSEDGRPRVRVFTGQDRPPGFRVVIPPMPELAPLADVNGLSKEDRERLERELRSVRERVRESQKQALESQREAIKEQARAREALREALEGQERRLADSEKWTSSPGKLRLGIEIESVDEALKSHVGEGVLVRSVREGSVAEKIGLQRNDIIRSVNQVPATDPVELRKQVVEAEGELTLEVIRAGKPLTLTVPAPQPDSDKSAPTTRENK